MTLGDYARYFFPIKFRMLGVRRVKSKQLPFGSTEEFLLHEFDLAPRWSYDYMYRTHEFGNSVSSKSGDAVAEYIPGGYSAMKVTCDVSNLKQLKLQIFSIRGREDCKRYGRGCSLYYTTEFEGTNEGVSYY